MKKSILAGTVIAITALAATAFIAVAQTSVSPTANRPGILRVSADGGVLLRGTIDSVSSNSVTVKSWGGDWTVNISPSTKVLPANTEVIEYKDGDFIGIQGTINQNANWTVDATLVRDWTYRQAMNQERRQNVQSAREAIQAGTPRNYVGTASNVNQTANGGSFTLTTSNGTSYTVNTASNAEIVNRGWITLNFTKINSGDNVRVWGVNASGTITAQIVRDVSLPARVNVGVQNNVTVNPPDGLHQ